MEDNFKDKFINKYLLFSIAGLVLFLVLAATLPFKDRFFALLYPKPSSFATQDEGWKGYDEQVQKGKIKAAEQVITVQLSYNAQNTPQVTIKNAHKRKGYASPYPPPDNGGYTLQLLDNQNNILDSIIFEVPHRIITDIFAEGSNSAKLKGNVEVPKTEELFFTLPDYNNAAQFKLLDPNKKIIGTKDLKNIPIQNNKPDFRSITGDEFLKTPKEKLLKLITKNAYAGSTDQTYVDFVFIGDSYSNLDAFNNDVNRLIPHLLTYEPYKSRAERIRFHTVNNTSSLGCSFSNAAGEGAQLDCDVNLIKQKVAAAGVPYEVIYVIVNRSNVSYFAGKATLGGDLAYGYNGLYAPQVFVHEAGGHAFGSLLDEYDTHQGANGPVTNITITNCFAGPPPSTGIDDWKTDGVAPAEYTPICNYANWYASSPTSIMRVLDSASYFFNAVSRRYINNKINQYANQTIAATPAPSAPGSGSQCNYYQSCTKPEGKTGIQQCTGTYGGTTGSTVCEWDTSGTVPPNCQSCTCDCAYAQACKTAEGLNGVQTCSGTYGGTTGGTTCEWDASGVCSPNCTECKAASGGIVNPSPSPGSWQACGTCAVGCGGDNTKSHCFAGTTDMGCQSAYQCQLAPDNICQWNPGSCTSSGGNMTCLECGFHMARLCEPKTSLITWETPSGNVCSNQWSGYSWGPLARQIQQNLNDCQYINEHPQDFGGGCSGTWGYDSVNLESCICGSSTADTKITFSNNNPQAGQKFTVFAKSFKNYDQGSGGGSAKDPMAVKLAAFNAQGVRTDLGTPTRTSTQYVTSYQCADTTINPGTGNGDGNPWPQRVYEWDVSLPSSGTYSFQLSVQELYYVCATSSLNVLAPPPTPTPIPAPAAPNITLNTSCVNDPYNGSQVNISWTNPGGAPVSWADISPNIYFNSYWNKNVSGLTSTTAPAGFSNSPSLLPDIPYYVRLYNGVHSPIASFVLLSCPAPVIGSGTGLTGTYYDNIDFTGISVSRNDLTINFNWGLNSPHAIIGSDTFSARWIGEIQAQYSQNYTFYTVSDDGVRVWIDNQLIINNWTDHPATENSGTISLTAGQKYPIKVEFYENSTDARIELYWSSTYQAKQIIPSSQLYPAALSSTYGTISGTISSSAGGVVAGTKISINIKSSKKTYYSNSMGVYSIPNLPPGTYTLMFQAKGYTNKSISVTVSSGSTTSGNVTLTKK